MIEPVLRYPGSKARIAAAIVDLMPAHDAYVEPFFGSGAVLFAKPRARTETVNDLDGRVVNFFRVARDRPGDLAAALALTPYARAELGSTPLHRADSLQDARRFAVECWQSREGYPRPSLHWRRDLNGIAVAGTWARLPDKVLAVADRLLGVQIENLDAMAVIAGSARAGTLIYADPPYVGRDLYGLGFTYEQHEALLSALRKHPGPVVLSGHESLLYDRMLAGWAVHRLEAKKLKNVRYDDVVWVKERA